MLCQWECLSRAPSLSSASLASSMMPSRLPPRYLVSLFLVFFSRRQRLQTFIHYGGDSLGKCFSLISFWNVTCWHFFLRFQIHTFFEVDFICVPEDSGLEVFSPKESIRRFEVGFDEAAVSYSVTPVAVLYSMSLVIWPLATK